MWEGILKFVYANQGIGRFTKLGMPLPHFTANYAQLFTAVFLMVNGPGRWSLDTLLSKQPESRGQAVAASRRKESANASVMV